MTNNKYQLGGIYRKGNYVKYFSVSSVKLKHFTDYHKNKFYKELRTR